ncbi:hypothetical protein [Winogradskyella vincentii]|uniref:Lipoprotein n=1 Tax=Winogradskyella vincentii TaxID=2877122 RepID=A0ABS7Y258_9FLAO|nr:hypothetical protein [Winogradskyella vincentii]MCA0152907.1 hypothetical protein [Winogradskyella vincentii]
MKSLMTIIILSVFTFFSCSKDSSNNDEGRNEICYKFIDKETNIPIQGLGVFMSIERPLSGVGYDIRQITDLNGEICFTPSSSLGDVLHFEIQENTDQLYWSPFCMFLNWPHPDGSDFNTSRSFYLSPTAYIRFHIQSFTPENNDDNLHILYNFLEIQTGDLPYHCPDGIILNEIQSDTVIIKNTRAGSNAVVWNKYINNNSINSGEQDINISTADTLDVEINHQ